uniref:E3 ubiquitin-protein ligase XIAP-like n=1 Tax=Hirondellea gigas TaxID=1518452 RepID=A0A2P2HXT5_9CRUS
MGSTSHNHALLADVTYRERTYTFLPAEELDRIKPRDLALAGFFHTSHDNEVKCFECGLVLDAMKFPTPQQLIEHHIETMPECKFLSSSNFTNSKTINRIKSANNSSSSGATSESNAPMVNGVSPPTSTASRPVECKGFHTFDSLRYERERLATFIDWPVSWLTPDSLAKDGFYYLREKDHCSCVFCRGIVGAWEPGDLPNTEHHRHFPMCAFVKGQPVGNIPILQGDLLAALPTDGPHLPPVDPRAPANCTIHQRARFCTRHCKPAISPATASATVSKKDVSGIPEASSQHLEGEPLYSGPKRLEYLTKESRVKSYKNWPRKVKQTPDELAEAGFFYCGLSDHVRCFHCGNGLRNWEADDEPWVEHARWYPQCNFVLLNKGVDYIDTIRREAPPYFRMSPKKNESSDSSGSSASSSPYVSNTYTSDVLSNYRVCVTEQQLDVLMQLDIQKAVLELGFSISNVRKALRKKIEETGVPFFNLETCIEKVLNCAEESQNENEAEQKQDLKLRSYQREREERIRQSHVESLRTSSLVAAAAASANANEESGEDVVNTRHQIESSSNNNLEVNSLPPLARTPIMTSPVMPPRREHSSTDAPASTAGSTALTTNINMQRVLTFAPAAAGINTSLNDSGNPRDINLSFGESSETGAPRNRSSDSNNETMESEDIVEYPLVARSRDAYAVTNGTHFTDTLVSVELQQEDVAIVVDRDVTPTNDVVVMTSIVASSHHNGHASDDEDFNSTSTPRASPTPVQTFFQPNLVVTMSPPLPRASSSASTASGNSSGMASDAESVSLEMLSQVDKVINLAEKEQMRVCRHLSDCSARSHGSSTGSQSAGSGYGRSLSSDGENSGAEECSSLSDADIDLQEQLIQAKKQVASLTEQLEKRSCKICMDADITTVLLPCKHMATCTNCTLALSCCPICRTQIRQVLKPNIVA